MFSIRDINKEFWNKRQKEFKKRYRFENRFKIAYRRLLHHQPGTWLDIGTGNGYLATIIRGKLSNTTAIGIDFVSEILSQTNDLNYRLVVDIDRSDIPFVSNSFDYVTCLEVLEHLIFPEHTLKEISRVLKPGGYCLISVPNIQFVEYLISLIKGKVPLPAADPRHMSVYTLRHLKKELIRSNFSINYAAGCDASPAWFSKLSKCYLCKTIILEGKKS